MAGPLWGHVAEWGGWKHWTGRENLKYHLFYTSGGEQLEGVQFVREREGEECGLSETFLLNIALLPKLRFRHRRQFGWDKEVREIAFLPHSLIASPLLWKQTVLCVGLTTRSKVRILCLLPAIFVADCAWDSLAGRLGLALIIDIAPFVKSRENVLRTLNEEDFIGV